MVDTKHSRHDRTGTEMNTDTITKTVDAWTKEPDKARGAPAVTARAEESQAVIQAGAFTWHADLPPALGGTSQAPTPTALLLGALAGCAIVFVRDTLAPQLGVRVTGVEATVRCETDARGLLGMGGAEPDLRGLSLEVSIDSPDGQDAVERISAAWQERCPIYLALVKPTDVALSFRAT
jgi:uncharacterized OsmC-like protein